MARAMTFPFVYQRHADYAPGTNPKKSRAVDNVSFYPSWRLFATGIWK